MAEYIDKAVALSIHEPTKSNRHYQTDNLDDAYGQGWDDALCSIEHIPASDVAPVVHGRWIEPACLYYGAKQYECSLCHSDTFWRKHSITVKYPYCPNCGCRMDGGDDE